MLINAFGRVIGNASGGSGEHDDLLCMRISGAVLALRREGEANVVPHPVGLRKKRKNGLKTLARPA
jgi:hypothetical protein